VEIKGIFKGTRGSRNCERPLKARNRKREGTKGKEGEIASFNLSPRSDQRNEFRNLRRAILGVISCGGEKAKGRTIRYNEQRKGQKEVIAGLGTGEACRESVRTTSRRDVIMPIGSSAQEDPWG